jgi:hypothetical protein
LFILPRKSPRTSHTPDAYSSRNTDNYESESRGKPNPVVQSLIEKQRQNLKEEIERAKKQSALRQFTTTITDSHVVSKSMNNDDQIFEEPAQ